ncbi:MAG: hypothetical protein M3Q24_01910 [bacterium]|nr:hypothetical protein [bacterium]
MEIDIKNLHHAYFLLGNKKVAEDFLNELFVKLNVKITGNPDVIFWRDVVLGIDQARNLKLRSESKAFGDKKIFVIASQQITPEAQNALLKIFEEPRPNTHFFILADRNILIETLLSRMNVVRLNGEQNLEIEAQKFLKSNVANRLVLVKEIIAKDEFDLPTFLDDILSEMRNYKKSIKYQKIVFNVSLFANDSAANKRLILEHLALCLPESLE